MIFAFPYALIGTVALAGLIAIYTFRIRFKRKPVSSLMLWQQTRRPLQGGTHRDRLTLPPLFYLELLTLLLLILAALGPHLRRPESGTLTVIFDPSASMSAITPQGETAQAQAIRKLRSLADAGQYAALRILFAHADGPQNSGLLTPRQALTRLAATSCHATTHSIEASLARATDLCGDTDDIVVLTDHPPPPATTLRPGLRWFAFGTPLANSAITIAERTWNGRDGENLLVVVTTYPTANPTAATPSLSPLPLRITTPHSSAPVFSDSLTPDATGTATLQLQLPYNTPPLNIELPPDPLTIDNHALLLPDTPRPIAVAVNITDPALSNLVNRALSATRYTITNTTSPQLIFSDTTPRQHRNSPWHFVITPPQAPQLSRGPYLVDHSHPLLEGISFAGLVWPAGTNQLPGTTLLYSGNRALLSVSRYRRTAPTFHLVSSSAADPLYRSPAWPSLIWNLTHLCAAAQPCATAANLRLGKPTNLNAPPDQPTVTLTTPDGKLTIPADNGTANWTPTRPGLHYIESGGHKATPLSVNFFSATESNLATAGSGIWGTPAGTSQLRRSHRPYAWAAAALALLLLACHQLLSLKRSGY